MREILFGTDGNARFVYSDEDAAFMREVAPGSTERTARASHVEPSGDGGWEADMRPVGGPVILDCRPGVGSEPGEICGFATRDEALQAEAAWLRRNGLPLPL